jgi:hypothetical protein
MESQQTAKQSRNEAEQMKDRLKALQEELKHHAGSEDNRSREELIQIRQRCEALEADNARCLLVYSFVYLSDMCVVGYCANRQAVRQHVVGRVWLFICYLWY